MCMSCGCWMDQSKGGDGNHLEDSTKMPNVKTIRFGQQGVTGDKQPTKRQASFKARHAKNISKGKMSAAYWADKVKW